MDREQIRRVMIGVNIIEGSYDEISRRLGIKENLLVLLYALDDGRAHSQVEISRNWMMPRTTLNTIVKECVAKGLVTLEPQPHTREKYLRLTPAGQAWGQKILPPVYQAEQRAFEEVLGQAGGAFVEGFEAFARALCREMGSPCPPKEESGDKSP